MAFFIPKFCKLPIKVLVIFCTILLSGGSIRAYDNLPPLLSGADCEPSTHKWEERALARSTVRQLGLPSMLHPEDNSPSEVKIQLGRKLFFDRRLSINKTMSCAMCHVPEQAFTNWEMQTSVGVEGRSVKRNAPSLINVGFLKFLFHDGRDKLLETQFVGPLTARNEMSNPSVGMVIELLRSLSDYEEYFLSAFGGHATLDRVGMALGAYQRTLVGGGSPFDQWYFGNKEHALTSSQKRGFRVFMDKGGCGSCHSVEKTHALFTDNSFHDTGYGWMREQKRQNPPKNKLVQVAPGVSYEISNDQIMSVGEPEKADLGRYEVTEKTEDRWKFRTSSLRNIAKTGPYMHDGGLQSLVEVIEFYNRGGPGHKLQDKRIQPLKLTNEEKTDLIQFLESLTSKNLSCLIAEARQSEPDNHESVAER